jgi:hypothetical protein
MGLHGKSHLPISFSPYPPRPSRGHYSGAPATKWPSRPPARSFCSSSPPQFLGTSALLQGCLSLQVGCGLPCPYCHGVPLPTSHMPTCHHHHHHHHHATQGDRVTQASMEMEAAQSASARTARASTLSTNSPACLSIHPSPPAAIPPTEPLPPSRRIASLQHGPTGP